MKLAAAPHLFKAMVEGARTENALKLYAATCKAARGEKLSTAHRVVKASTASDYADELLDEFGIDVHGMGIETEMPEWLLEAAFDRLSETFDKDYWQDINETTADMIEDVLRDGIERGLSTQEIADEITGVAPERAGWRAMNCARTEVGNAMNAGHEASIRELGQDTGEEVKKQWLSVCGNTTRPDHCAADGISVDVDDVFDIGGEVARWPGDENLSAENRCNCQCTLISDFVASELGDDSPDYLTEYGQFGGEASTRPTGLKFDESQHPRDESGRFSDGGGSDKPAVDSGSSGESKPTNPPIEKPASVGAATKEILDRASKIEFADGDSESEATVERDDYDGIEDKMTPREVDRMNEHIDEQVRQMAYDSVDSMNIDTDISDEDVANEAGYSESEINDKIAGIIDGHPELIAVLNDWSASGYGMDAVDEIIGEIESKIDELDDGEDAAKTEVYDKIKEKLSTYRDRADGDIEGTRESMQETAVQDAQDSAIEDYVNDYDTSDLREEYLRQFYDDNEDRYQAPIGTGKWHTISDDFKYRFNTTSGAEFSIDGYGSDLTVGDETFGRVDIQFSDERGSFSVTGKGGAFEVFGNVVPAVTALINKKDPDLVTFSAAETSRQKLYDRLVKTVLKADDSRVAKTFTQKGGGVREYVVYRKADAVKVEAKLQDLAKRFYMSDSDVADLTPRSFEKDGTEPEFVFEDVEPMIDLEWFTPEGWQDADADYSKADEQKTWNEEDHPRDDHGRFGSGGGGVATADDEDHDNGGRDYGASLSPKQERQVKSEQFKNWFGDWEKDPSNASKIVDDQGKPQKSFNYSKAVDEDGNPVVVYHGTTHEFTEFNNDRANAENHLGKGFYFTESKADADSNYAGEGPDLRNRIANLQDQLRDSSATEGVAAAFEAATSQADLDHDAIREAVEGMEGIHDVDAAVDAMDRLYQESPGTPEDDDIAEALAKSQLVGSDQKIIPAFLNIRNPVVLGNPGEHSSRDETFFELREQEVDSEGRTPDDENFDPDTAEFTGEIVGNGGELLDAIRETAGDYENADGDAIAQAVMDEFSNHDSELSAESVRKAITSSDAAMDITDQDGKLASGDFVARVFQKMGFDGIIYKDASKHFERMGITPGTRHFIAWEPTQVKSAVANSGDFDPDNPDFTKTFDEGEHPRDDHGRFTDGSGGDDSSSSENDSDNAINHRDDPTKSLPERGKVAVARADAILVQGIENGDEVSRGAADWDSLDDDDKMEALQYYENDNYDSVYSEVSDEWHKEMESEAESEASSDIEDDTDGAGMWLADQLEAEGYSRESVESAVTSVDYDELHIVAENLEWDDPDAHEGLDPAKEYIEKYKKLTDADWRSEYESRVEARKEELLTEKTEDGMPDSYSEGISETLSQGFYDLTDEQKLEYAQNAGVDSAGTSTLEEPTVYEVMEGGESYRQTGVVARYLQKQIGDQELERRGVKGKVDMDEVASRMWSQWKSSSTTPTGLLLQYATAKELGGHTQEFSADDMRNIKKAAFELSKTHDSGTADFGPQGESNARAEWHYERGLAIAQSHVHGTWAASQYILDRAGMKEVPVYRGIIINKDEIDKEPQETVDGYTKLTDIKLLRYGAASSTSEVSVANEWGGVGKKPPNPIRVVLRVQAPPTAILSLPAFGQNIHNEKEVVLAGTKDWKAWDAWVEKAPTAKKLTIKYVGGTILDAM